MEKILKIIIAVIVIIASLKIIIVKKFYARGGEVDFSSPFLHWPIGLFFLFTGIYLLYAVFIKKNYDID